MFCRELNGKDGEEWIVRRSAWFRARVYYRGNGESRNIILLADTRTSFS